MDIVTIDQRTIKVDDDHPLVFSEGFWAKVPMLGTFNDAVSYSNTSGSTKMIRFIGTSITVLGGLQKYSPGYAPPLTSFSIDDEPPVTYFAPSPPLYTAVVYFESKTLKMGEHILAIENIADNNIVHLDAFVIQAASHYTPSLLRVQSDSSSTSVEQSTVDIDTPSSQTLPFSSSSTAAAGYIDSSIPGSSSTTSTAATSSPAVTSIRSLIFPNPTQRPTDVSASKLASPAMQSTEYVIVACVCAATGALFMTSFVCIILLRRCRRRKQHLRQLRQRQQPDPFVLPLVLTDNHQDSYLLGELVTRLPLPDEQRRKNGLIFGRRKSIIGGLVREPASPKLPREKC